MKEDIQLQSNHQLKVQPGTVNVKKLYQIWLQIETKIANWNILCTKTSFKSEQSIHSAERILSKFSKRPSQ